MCRFSGSQNQLVRDEEGLSLQEQIKYSPTLFTEGSPWYHPGDDAPPRCRSCGSTNLEFALHSNQRFWVCLACGRQSGEAARYDKDFAFPP